MTSSFYGPKKSVYLTPLERKALKESLPPPPPAQVNKAETKIKKAAKGKQAKAAKGKQAKAATTSSIRNYAESNKTVRLSKMNWSRFVQEDDHKLRERNWCHYIFSRRISVKKKETKK